MTETFREFVESREERGINIWIDDTPTHPNSDLRRHTAVDRIAEHITPDEGNIINAGDDVEITENDTVIIDVIACGPETKPDVAGTAEYSNTITVGRDVPHYIRKLFDCFITVTHSGDVNSIYELEENDYRDASVKKELEFVLDNND